MSTMKKVDAIGMERTESSAVTRRVKRRHSEEFKAQVIAACEARARPATFDKTTCPQTRSPTMISQGFVEILFATATFRHAL